MKLDILLIAVTLSSVLGKLKKGENLNKPNNHSLPFNPVLHGPSVLN